MYSRSIYVALALVLGIALACGISSAEENLRQISGGGITVYYPAGMDAQAKKILTIAQTSIGPSLEVQRSITTLLTDVDSMSKDIADLLGASEKESRIKTRLQSYKDKSIALSAAFSRIHLVRKSSAAATNGVDAGVMQVRYSKDKDEFTMVMDDSDYSPDRVKRSYMPVLVNADGSIRSENKLGQMAVDFLGVGDGIAIAPVHDTVSFVIADQLKIYHPLTRWFNEGVSGWVTRQVVTKYGPKLASVVNNAMMVNAKSKDLRAKVNLLAWPQLAYVNRSEAYFDPAMETANTQYSIAAISDLLGKNGAQVLPKIMKEVSNSGNPDTDAICNAIKTTASKDFKTTLMTYVPQDIKDGIESGEAKKLYAKAETLVQQKKWSDAVDTLRRALQMTPDDVNCRLNLAWLEREINQRQDSEIQVFLSAGMLKQQKYSFHMLAPSIESYYVMGRLAILMGNIDSAKQLLTTVLEYKPDHADAKRAMDEVKKIEDAAKS